MKKIVLLALVFVLVLGGGSYFAYKASNKNMSGYFMECSTTLHVSEKLKAAQSNDEINKITTDVVQCIQDRQTFIDSIFYSQKKILGGIKIKQNLKQK
ncbi:MAG: hypothetical protein HY081_03165 [Gammaproteobacteria bacterium]|nr:hypothetical protein [Gammaproteobacteria bacterium]